MARLQASLARIGRAGLEGGALEDVLAVTVGEVGDALGVPDVVLLELDRTWSVLHGRAARIGGELLAAELVRQVRVPAGTGSMAGFTVDQGEAVVSSDLAADERFEARGRDYGLQAEAAVAVPVGLGERPWGVLVVYAPEVRDWTADEVAYASSVGATVGLTVARTELERDLRDAATRLDLSLAAGGMGAWTWDLGADRVELSQQALELLDVPEGFDGRSDAFLAVVHRDDQPILRGDVYEALQTDGETHGVFRLAVRGETRWIESWGRLLSGPKGPRLVGVVADITERQLAEETREALLAREQRARVVAEQARERMALLARTGERLAGSLEVGVVLDIVLDTCVPRLADVCLIDLLDDDGRLVEVAATATTDQALADVRELRTRRAALGGVGGIYSERQVAGLATPVLIRSMGEDDYVAASVDDDHLALFRRFDARSSIVVPLVSRGRVIGVISLLLRGGSRRYDDEDLDLASSLSTRAALAVENARLYEARNRVARSLQDALLPPALPDVPGLELAARYRVAEADTEIGGDFYDVVEVADGAWAVVVGDVCGRGPDAAALTGLVRHSVRTAVVRERVPSRILALANDAVLGQIDDARFCTAAFLRVVVAPGGGGATVTASSAGHPRPVLLRADGTTSLLDCAGVLIGVVPSPPLVDLDVALAPGDAVVLYTDGVTEARRGRELFGDGRLLETVQGLAGASAEALARGIEDAVVAFQEGATDDVAIVALRVSAAAG